MSSDADSQTQHPLPSTTATLGEWAARASSAAHEPKRGDTVGRFVLLSKLGEGGMGVVWAAHDAELDRKVAVKLLRPVLAGLDSSTGPSRLVREAQALARLSHPHVVTVHDVGSVGARVWIAMEYVEGKTLAEWLAERPRRWQQVLAVLRDAGAGLAAAHAKALVHRDFKPENVMVGDDGRVRVMDFGLARAREGERQSVAVDRLIDRSEILETEITAAGSILGTPAYMAPEQHLGLPTDARSDQFSFCVAAWEALYGVRPFRGETHASLAFAVTEGRRQSPPRGHPLPGRVRRALERGLAVAPEDRHVDMNALLSELAIDGGRRWRWALLAALPLAGATAALVQGVFAAPDAPPPCSDMESQLRGAWGDERRGAVERAVAAVDVGYAEATAAQVGRLLDEYAQGWVAARRDACEATRVRGDQSEELMDRRIACLDQRRLHLQATVDVLEAAEVTIVAKAVDAVLALPRVEPCGDASWLLTEDPPPDDPEVAAAVEEIRGQLARIDALEKTAQYDLALSIAEEALARAVELDRPRTRDLVATELAQVLIRKGRYEDAEKHARTAYYSALARADLTTAARASLRLANSGQIAARYEEGQWWAQQSDALAQARHDDVGRGHALKYLGLLQSSSGDYDEAEKTMTKAMELFAEALGDDHVLVASMLTNLGGVYHRQERMEEAIDHFRRALPLLRAGYGDDHPTIATTLTNLGGSLHGDGQLPAARESLESAVASYERMFGPDHPDLAGCVMNLGLVARDQGNLDEALALFERARAIWSHHLGDSHPNLAFVSINRAKTLVELERLPEARVESERATALVEAAHGREHPLLIRTYYQQSRVARAEGRLGHAEERLNAALAVVNATQGPDFGDAADLYEDLSRVALDRHDPGEALEHARKAVALREANEATAAELAGARAELARVLWELPAPQRDRTTALALARASVEVLRAEAKVDPKDLAELEEWLRERNPSSPATCSSPPCE